MAMETCRRLPTSSTKQLVSKDKPTSKPLEQSRNSTWRVLLVGHQGGSLLKENSLDQVHIGYNLLCGSLSEYISRVPVFKVGRCFLHQHRQSMKNISFVSAIPVYISIFHQGEHSRCQPMQHFVCTLDPPTSGCFKHQAHWIDFK